MKIVRRLLGFMLALIVTIPVNTTVVRATTEDCIPDYVRLYDTIDESAIQIELADLTQTIDNIQTNNNDLFAMLTKSYLAYEDGSEALSSIHKNNYTIGLRSKTDGTYTVSFDILDKNKEKVATKEVKVYAYDSPIKSITFDGEKSVYNGLKGKSAKVKVTLTSGNKIKKLEYGVYNTKKDEYGTTSEMVYKTFKNGTTVTFGTNPYYSDSDYSVYSENYSAVSKDFDNGMICPTDFIITYYDEYTKQDETISAYYYKYVE